MTLSKIVQRKASLKKEAREVYFKFEKSKDDILKTVLYNQLLRLNDLYSECEYMERVLSEVPPPHDKLEVAHG